MKYSFASPVRIERATPAGLEEASFDAGEVEIAEDSNERFLVEQYGLDTGVIQRVATKTSKNSTPEE